MDIITELYFELKNSSVCLGKFDGLHKGHRLLLDKIICQKNFVPTVFTFEASKTVSKIYTQGEKNLILQNMGIRREIIFPFNEQTKKMSPEKFIEEILVKQVDVKYICVGEDFRFGRNREGDVHTLERYQDRYGYLLKSVPKLADGEGIISSTRIRGLMEKGEMRKVNALLGAPYFICGKVLHGNGLGHTLDMPTANIVPDKDKKLLPFGVYATKVKIGDNLFDSVTNVGRKPTVGGDSAGVETYIMDFHQAIYGESIQVFFYEFLRPERKFQGLGELQEQMERDKREAYRRLRA